MFSMVTAMMGTITAHAAEARPASTRLRSYLAMAGGEATVNDDDISPKRRG